MFGLAAAISLATMAFAAFDTASATTVCTLGATTSPCASGEIPYTGEIVAQLKPKTEAVFSGGAFTVKCPSSLLSGKINSDGSGEITKATFGGTCTTCPKVEAVTSPPWKITATTSVGPHGTLTVQSPRIIFKNCSPFGAECEASASNVVLDLDGGEPAYLLAKAEPLTVKTLMSFGCGTSTTWTAEYEVSLPTSGIYLR